MKVFNTTGVCTPEKHYMVDLASRLEQIKAMVDDGQYFTINRARQYGKTTTLSALGKYLADTYLVIDIDFQDIGDAGFANEDTFSRSFSLVFADSVREQDGIPADHFGKQIEMLANEAEESAKELSLLWLFRNLRAICAAAKKPLVLMIDEVDSATNNQVFLDFLAQLRSLYLKREKGKLADTFQSVILAGVTDVKNLKRKLRPDEVHKYNSPWNIAADFNVDMSFSSDGIAGMLAEYEADHHTGMDTALVAEEIHRFTNGYPYLVSRVCQLMDTKLAGARFRTLAAVWTTAGVSEAARLLVSETNTLFDSLISKVYDNAEMRSILERILFAGDTVTFNAYNLSIADAKMYGFVRNDHGNVLISNRIFETFLYNYFLSTYEMQEPPLYQAGANEKLTFVENRKLLMEKLLASFMTVFNDLYGTDLEKFDEAEGRRRFLLFVRPIINGTGNYYIETQTRDNKRMDLVIDYLGERHVIELKIWGGKAYHEKGERQLADYLESYHLGRGYLLTYCFTKKKRQGISHTHVKGIELIEALV